ncbi:MAG: hypothetical protein GC162_19700 [Planctomycetes bacterium]|nr:hypothetical protein [Planctomycetota bacterium]
MFARFIRTLIIVLCLSPAALAIRPGEWKHQTEADFAAATLDHTVATNLGEVQLSLDTKELAQLEGDDSIVYDIARLPDGRVFLAVGPHGKLVQLDGEKVTTVAEYEGAQVFSLEATKAGLWVGVSGATSKLELRTGDKMEVKQTIELKDVRYVWDLLLLGQRMFIATGASGQVLAVDVDKKEPKPIIALDCEQDNVLCLGSDGAGRIYAGTDGDGLVYRLTPMNKGEKYDAFVIYDAPEPEIGALLVLPDGTVYAGTADAAQARPGRLEEASTEQKGHPEKLTKEPTEPKLPNIPPKPEPKPGDKPHPAEPNKAQAPAAPGSEVAEAKPQAPAKPTPEQYNELRDAVAARLEEARKSGRISMQAGSRSGPSGATVARLRNAAAGGGSTRRPGAAPTKEGNAIYRISADGFVREVFRESVMILRIVKADDTLLVATGNEGQLYRVSPDVGEVTILADLEPQQVPALFDLGKGEFLVGTANPGRIMKLTDAYAPAGTLTSITLDAKQISLWGNLQVMASTPKGTSVEIQTRSGNVGDPDAGSWSPWSDPQKIDPTGASYFKLLSPSARFLQYRLTLNSDGKASPSVISVALRYLMPNLPPTINSIKAEYAQNNSRGGPEGAEPQPKSVLKVDWEASDANADKLTYTLEAKPFATDAPYITIADKIDANSFDWDTRTMPDGRYTLRITASDAADNIPDQALSSSRRSDPVTVDNTPPDVGELAVKTDGKTATVSLKASDALSPIAEVRYALDSEKDWHLVLPEDLIYDSTLESVVVKMADLAPGRHVVTVRVADTQGNTRYVSQTFDIKAK